MDGTPLVNTTFRDGAPCLKAVLQMEDTNQMQRCAKAAPLPRLAVHDQGVALGLDGAVVTVGICEEWSKLEWSKLRGGHCKSGQHRPGCPQSLTLTPQSPPKQRNILPGLDPPLCLDPSWQDPKRPWMESYFRGPVAELHLHVRSRPPTFPTQTDSSRLRKGDANYSGRLLCGPRGLNCAASRGQGACSLRSWRLPSMRSRGPHGGRRAVAQACRIIW